ncbi:coiled-coil domain-containing protein 114 [Triplophysa dalaica]|uniref:coiled-coil domain-containing protein 114 n=1 Tax=Triplophysa dalaica TaxID=1582913 RepID=UPI0024E0360C|nr:coiled-coil domain-containing protein 114 [Triplophysa dalaica]XP_056590107.1 coiled-coil domain-containing protein 114 [Triplophysa dalaica]XP_056590108.1 coiled-coil domain-containing protein 114 [Triplophysa dalaica]XP_056590109.1 coiled-coil domain-containing protein 114 [Triplophysa dalaica]
MPRGRANSALSDSNDMDFDRIAETELAKLQRQYRMMESDHQAHKMQSEHIIRKQREEISKLREEQEELLRSLRVSECQARRQSDSQDTQSLRTLLERSDVLDEQLESERQTQSQLKQEIMNMEKRLQELRRGEVSEPRLTSQSRHAQKASRTLENKLNLALVRFNELMTKNSQLREDIETLRMERVRFQQLHRKLEKKLQDIRKEIRTAYDVRAEAQAEMSMMKEMSGKDLVQYLSETKELERVIAHERRLKEFMNVKCHERTTLEDDRRTEMKEQRKTDTGEETPDTLEEVFQKIQEMTGENDLEMLVTNFIQVEDRKFALFNYVNDQNTKAEILREQIYKIREEMEQFRLEGVKREQEYKLALEQVKDQQIECETQAQQYEAQADDISKTLGQIKAGVECVFSKTDCDRTLVEDTVGSSTGIRDSNIMSYLALLEQKATELLAMQAFINSKDLEKNYDPEMTAQFLLGQNPGIERQVAVVQPSINRDNSEVEDSSLTDEEDRPLSQGELLQHIRRHVSHKKDSVLIGRGDAKTPKISTMSSSRQRSL